MQEKKLHKLGKTDLLTIIYEQEKKINELNSEVTELQEKLEDKNLKIKEAGSIAEASLKLNEIFETAQKAADEYLNSIKEVNKLSQGSAEVDQTETKEKTKRGRKKKNVDEENADGGSINDNQTKEECKELVLANNDLDVIKPKLLERVLIFLISVKEAFLVKTKLVYRKSRIFCKKNIRTLKRNIHKLYNFLKKFIAETKEKVQTSSKKIIQKIKTKKDDLKENFKLKGKELKKKKDKKKKEKAKLKKQKENKKEKEKIKKQKGKTKKQEDKVKKNSINPAEIEISIEELEEELNKRKERRKKLIFLRTMGYASLVIVAAAIIISTTFFKILEVSGNSMEPNLYEGDLLITSKFFGYEKGDIIAFYYNDNVLIKRVIATEGDSVSIEYDGTVYVNSQKLEEDYVKELSLGNCDITFPYIVEKDCVFVLGDNRENSIDSRSEAIGCISEDKIIGKIQFKLNPFVIY